MITSGYLRKGEYFPTEKRTPERYTSISSHATNLKNLNEPLNAISSDLTFKGSPFKGDKNKLLKISEAVKKFAEEFGESAAEHFKSRIEHLSKIEDSGVKVSGDEINFKEQSNGRKIKDIILYPIKEMPFDIAEGFLVLLKKIPGLKKSKGIDDLLNSKRLKGRREAIQHTSDAAAIQKYFEMVSSGDKKVFQTGHNRFNPNLSNYNTTHERALTRFVTGSIPAFFLGKDAYNLYMYMDGDDKKANREEKRRFNQEMARVIITSAMTFGVLSFFAKKSNSSETTAALLTSGLVLVAEVVGRMMVGTPVLPVSKETAKKYAVKRDKIELEGNKKPDKKAKGSFKGLEGKEVQGDQSKPPKKGYLTFKNIMKVLGVLVVAGFAIEKATGIKQVKEGLDSLSKKYSSFFKKDFVMKRTDFNKMVDKLERNGFGKIADKYRGMVKDQKGDTFKIGQTTKTVENLLIHQILTFPVRFVWSTLMLPYKKVVKPLFNMSYDGSRTLLAKLKIMEPAAKKAEKVKTPEEIKKQEMAMLQNSVSFLKKIENLDDIAYKTQVNGSLLSGFDNVTKSNHSNADLSTIIKVTNSGVTSGFLIADNYNSVMIDSQGEDKELASQKAKERSIQRTVRVMYGAFIIALANGIFSKIYNGSLLGAQAVNIGTTFTTETLERKSVGMPTGRSTREEIIEKEQINLKASGLKGRYFRFMAFLTGKKPMSAKAAKVEAKKSESKKHKVKS